MFKKMYRLTLAIILIEHFNSSSTDVQYCYDYTWFAYGSTFDHVYHERLDLYIFFNIY